MLKRFVRFNSSSVPFEPVPLNKYNQARSAFNFKPKKTQGLVYNPPSSINKPSIKTAPAFLPPTDPRRSLPTKKFTAEELNHYPVIKGYNSPENRVYDITPEIVQQIQQLRAQDPEKWTISKLAAKFNLAQNKVNVLSGQLKEPKPQDFTPKQALKHQNRMKRTELWLKGEY
jgi:hypothetical protein